MGGGRRLALAGCASAFVGCLAGASMQVLFRVLLILEEEGARQAIGLLRNSKKLIVSTQMMEVLDVLILPALKSREVFVYFDCYAKGRRDSEILCVFDDTERQFFTRVRRAWRAKRREGKFEEIAPRDVKCENFGFGL